MNISKDFPMLDEDLIYFDNAATSLKPNCVIEKMNEYYKHYSANTHRGDYNISFKVDDEIDNVRESVKTFIKANKKEEIIFTSGTTESMNLIVFGFFERMLEEGDEILLTKSEHSSNILPWFILSLKKKVVIKYIELENNKLTINALMNSMSSKTKVVSIAHMTNTIGDVRNIKEISQILHKNNIFLVVDGAQSVPHIKTDVSEMNIDFLAFSAHKMCGPTGVGVLYGKYNLLNKMMPIKFGGGMNENYDKSNLKLSKIPDRFEGGTNNIAGIIGFGEALKYINNIKIENIEKHNKYLKSYLIKELLTIPYIDIINYNSEGSIVLINIKSINSGDLGLYLNSKKICVRSGSHCAKMISNNEGIGDTVRISLYFYNTYEEIDVLTNALKDKNAIKDFLKNNELF